METVSSAPAVTTEMPAISAKTDVSAKADDSAKAGVPRFLACRTDALTVAYTVVFDEPVLEFIRARHAEALKQHMTVELTLPSGLRVALKPTRGTRFFWECEEGRGVIDVGGAGGWTLEITFDAIFLTTHSHPDIIGAARRIAAGFGTIRGGAAGFHENNERVRRGDLCADFVHFSLQDMHFRQFLVRGNGRTCTFSQLELEAPLRRYVVNAKITGWVACPGGQVMGRLYDKTQELKLAAHEHKRQLEEEIWTQAGWQVGERVTRVEFQFRTTALKQLHVHTLEDYFGCEDKLWSYATQCWLSVRELGTGKRRTKWPIDERWNAAIWVTFFQRVSAPPRRERRRGGVSVGQARGATLSLLGGSGRLNRVENGPSAGPNASMLQEEREAARWVREQYRDYFRDAAMVVAEYDIKRFGAVEAARLLGERVNGFVARFASAEAASLPQVAAA